MPWVKFSDDWYDDDKLAGAPSDVLSLYAVGLSWCARNLTDGKVPSGVHRILVNLHGDPDEVVAELVARNAWQEVPGGWVIGNYHRYQPSRAEVLAKREKDAARKRTGRVREESDADSASDMDGSLERPVPGPVPVDPPVVVSESTHDVGPQAVDDGWGGLKATAWSQIAAWKAEDRGKIGNQGWLNSTRKNQPTDEHPDGGTFDQQADRLLEQHPGLTGHELAQALTGRLSKRTLSMRAAS
jgi:hypothetical protein